MIVGCLYLVKRDELKLSETAVLVPRTHIEKTFDNITKIVNGVLSRGVGGGDPLVRVSNGNLSAKKQARRLTTDLDGDIRLHGVTFFLLRNNTIPVDFILYSNKHTPAEARKNMSNFVPLGLYMETSYLMVGKDYGLEMGVKQIPYNIVGCVPQVVGKHCLC